MVCSNEGAHIHLFRVDKAAFKALHLPGHLRIMPCEPSGPPPFPRTHAFWDQQVHGNRGLRVCRCRPMGNPHSYTVTALGCESGCQQLALDGWAFFQRPRIYGQISVGCIRGNSKIGLSNTEIHRLSANQNHGSPVLAQSVQGVQKYRSSNYIQLIHAMLPRSFASIRSAPHPRLDRVPGS